MAMSMVAWLCAFNVASALTQDQIAQFTVEETLDLLDEWNLLHQARA